MKKIIIGIIVLMLIVSMGYIIFVSGEEWGFDTTDINSMRFKVNINFKDGTTSTLSTNPMIIMFNDKIVESITYYVDIKGSSEVYDVFEIQNYGLHYKLTDSTNTYKDKTFYNTDIKSFSANNQWYTLFEKTITCNDMEITSDISPTLSYGEYKIQLNGYFQYRYGDINWMEYNMDSTSLTVNYVEDTLTLDVTGGINLDNDDGDDTGDTPPDWDPPEEDDTDVDNEINIESCTLTGVTKRDGKIEYIYDGDWTVNPDHPSLCSLRFNGGSGTGKLTFVFSNPIRFNKIVIKARGDGADGLSIKRVDTYNSNGGEVSSDDVMMIFGTSVDTQILNYPYYHENVKTAVITFDIPVVGTIPSIYEVEFK